MTDDSRQQRKATDFKDVIGAKEKRKLRAVKQGPVGTWSAFRSMGAVGWLVSVPTVLGCFLGVWLDYTWPVRFSWTLTMLGAGLFGGCALAGFWMNREKNKIIKERDQWRSENDGQ